MVSMTIPRKNSTPIRDSPLHQYHLSFILNSDIYFQVASKLSRCSRNSFSSLSRIMNQNYFFKKLVFTPCKLNSHYKAWTYKKKEHKKIKAYRKSLYEKPTVSKCLLILHLKTLRSQVKQKYSIAREFQGLAVRGKKLLTQKSL